MSKGKRPHKQAAAIAALLSKPTFEEAAQAVGISERTLRTWMDLPDFASEYRRACLKVVESTVARLQRLAPKAVEALGSALDSDDLHPRIRAALGILDHGWRGLELMNLAGEVEELKRLIKEGTTHGDGYVAPRSGTAEGGVYAAGNGVADAGPASGGPGPDPGAGRHATGPVAEDVAPLRFPANDVAV